MGINTTIEGVFLTKLDIIDVPRGDVFHAMKKSDPDFSKFDGFYVIRYGKCSEFRRGRF